LWLTRVLRRKILPTQAFAVRFNMISVGFIEFYSCLVGEAFSTFPASFEMPDLSSVPITDFPLVTGSLHKRQSGWLLIF
jgi:hypothetical protein